MYIFELDTVVTSSEHSDVLHLRDCPICLLFLAENSLMAFGDDSCSFVNIHHLCVSKIQKDESWNSYENSYHILPPVPLVEAVESSAVVTERQVVQQIHWDHHEEGSGEPYFERKIPKNDFVVTLLTYIQPPFVEILTFLNPKQKPISIEVFDRWLLNRRKLTLPPYIFLDGGISVVKVRLQIPNFPNVVERIIPSIFKIVQMPRVVIWIITLREGTHRLLRHHLESILFHQLFVVFLKHREMADWSHFVLLWLLSHCGFDSDVFHDILVGSFLWG